LHHNTVPRQLVADSYRLTGILPQAGATEEIRLIIRQEGTSSIFADGIRKAVEGLTSIEEVMSVTYPQE
jgi:type II secretory ATPase GspE/PulE/Tfp pilus assembly ATPase PilB-like protein